MRIVRLVIHGRVQGVGFRCFIEGEASVSGTEGWVRNRRDGTVEVVLKGDEALIEGIINACRRGPPPVSHVEKIDISDAGEDDMKLRHRGEKFSSLSTV
jgi:acylphosphatase